MEVPQSYEARLGDEFDFHYTVSGWCKEGKILSLTHELDADPRWNVTEYDYDEDTGKLRLRVKIVVNSFTLMVIVATIAVIGGGLLAWLSLDKVDKITSRPIVGLSMLGAVAGGLMLLRKAW